MCEKVFAEEYFPKAEENSQTRGGEKARKGHGGGLSITNRKSLSKGARLARQGKKIEVDPKESALPIEPTLRRCLPIYFDRLT